MSHPDESQRNQATRDTGDGAGDQSAARYTVTPQQPQSIRNSSNGEQSRVEDQHTYANAHHNVPRPQEYDSFMHFQHTHSQQAQGMSAHNGGLQGNVVNPYMFPHYSTPGPTHYHPHIFLPTSTGISATPSKTDGPFPPGPPSNQRPQHGAVPAKVDGSRHPDPKGKGKQKAVDDEQPAASGSGMKRKAIGSAQSDSKKFRGCSSGSPNYNSEDVDTLLDISEELLPLGGNGWLAVEKAYNARAAESDRPQRSAKSLELKFKQLVKTTKPTGDAVCPPHVLRAHEIDDAMNEKVGTLDLDDEEIVDAGDDSLEQPSKKPPTLVLRCSTPDLRSAAAPPSSSCHSRAASQGMLANISAALDPARLQARHEEQSIQSMQANQIFQLSSQLRETQRRADSLSAQLFEAERRADRNELMGMLSDRRFGHQSSPPSRHHGGYRSSRSSRRRGSNPPRERRRYRQDIFYSDGGQATRWVGGSSDEEDVAGLNDSPGTRRIVDLNDSIVLPPRRSPSPSFAWSRSPSPSTDREEGPSSGKRQSKSKEDK